MKKNVTPKLQQIKQMEEELTALFGGRVFAFRRRSSFPHSLPGSKITRIFPLSRSPLCHGARPPPCYTAARRRGSPSRGASCRGARRFIFRKSPLPDFYESESTFLLSNHPIASTLSPPTLTSKCRWFPVEAPVVPT